VIDVDSFAAQLTACYQRMWLVAAAITGDRTEADDIVQEASMVGLQKRSDFAGGTDFAAWMCQIVRLTALNYRKKTIRRNLRVTDPAEIDQTNSDGASRGHDAQLPLTDQGRLRESQCDFDDEVSSALRGISDVARTCLLLRVVDQLSYDDISRMLQIPVGTAMSHVHRAKQSIRKRLRAAADCLSVARIREKHDEAV
jgi:RNA polymerase sigma-70 factor (ECF subfamily)